MKRWVTAGAVLVGACTDDLERSCEEQVCDHVVDCSPLTTAGWDWRSSDACIGTFACGPEGDACLAAIAALPCLSSPPTWEEIEANTRALVAVREACGEAR